MPRPRQDEPPPPSSPPRNRATAAPSTADGSADRCRLADVGTGHGAGPSGAGHSGAPSGRSVARLLASQQSLRRGRARGLQVGCALVLPERQPAERMAVTRVAVAHEAARRTTFCCQSLVPPTSLRGRHTLRFQSTEFLVRKRSWNRDHAEVRVLPAIRLAIHRSAGLCVGSIGGGHLTIDWPPA